VVLPLRIEVARLFEERPEAAIYTPGIATSAAEGLEGQESSVAVLFDEIEEVPEQPPLGVGEQVILIQLLPTLEQAMPGDRASTTAQIIVGPKVTEVDLRCLPWVGTLVELALDDDDKLVAITDHSVVARRPIGCFHIEVHRAIVGTEEDALHGERLAPLGFSFPLDLCLVAWM
jgi:hypothetical protein